MDRRTDARRERRLAVNTPVTVKLLGMLGEPTAAGRVLDMSGSGLRLTLPVPMPCGGQVRVEAEGMMMLGQVVRCQPSASETYSLGIALSHLEAVGLDSTSRRGAQPLSGVKVGN
ncbi:MAG TPA: PilZ domain-containing protein [Bryobacteraceae bacterium]|nr:PilZ domain-containing protein [Bryobacteraceae bacterium]